MPVQLDDREDYDVNGDAVDGSTADFPGSATVWPLITVVILTVVGIVLAVLNHARDKPDDYPANRAAAIRQAASTIGTQGGTAAPPLQFEQAAPETMQWHPIYICPTHGAVNSTYFDAAGLPHCPICKQVLMVKK